MRDALVQADIVQPLDAEMRGEPAAGAVRCGRVDGGGRDQMVEHDHDLGGVVNLQHLAPAFRQERHVHQHRGFDIDHGEVAGLDLGLAGSAGEDFFGDGHGHGGLPGRLGFGAPVRA